MLNTSKIEKIRKSKGVLQEAVCEKVGFSMGTYHNLLKNGEFRINHLEVMAKLFKVPLNDFFDEDIKTYNNNVNDINIVNDNKNGYGYDSDLKKENAALKKEIKYLKEINELLRNKTK